MSRRARYDGPHASVDVSLPDGGVVTVERGHQLPPDVPAKLRDELLEREDWSEVGQPKNDAKDGDA